jgi:hypothetical protein
MNGSVVVLRVEDPKLPKKKRVRDPLLFIQRMGDSGAILLSMPGYGCELLHPGKPIVAMDVYRIGIRMRLAAQLARALNAVLTER